MRNLYRQQHRTFSVEPSFGLMGNAGLVLFGCLGSGGNRSMEKSMRPPTRNAKTILLFRAVTHVRGQKASTIQLWYSFNKNTHHCMGFIIPYLCINDRPLWGFGRRLHHRLVYTLLVLFRINRRQHQLALCFDGWQYMEGEGFQEAP